MQENASKALEKLERQEDFTLLTKLLDTAIDLRNNDNKKDFVRDDPELRALIISEMKGLANKRGEDFDDVKISDTEMNKAIDIYFKQRLSFIPPKNKSFIEMGLAGLYVARKSITRNFVLPGMILAGMGYGGFSAINYIERVKLASEIKSVQSRVHGVYDNDKNLEGRLNDTLKNDRIAMLSVDDKRDFDGNIEEARKIVSGNNDFFNSYLSAQESSNVQINQENYQDVSKRANHEEEELAKASEKLSDAGDILDANRQLAYSMKNIKSSYASLKTLNLPVELSVLVEGDYSQAETLVSSRDLSRAKKIESSLTSKLSDYREVSTLQPVVEKVYKSIQEISKEEKANTLAQEKYNSAISDINKLDLSQATANLNQLRNLFDNLNTSYEVRIVNRPGVKSGIDRYFTDSSGKRASGFYVIVEAVDSNGQVIPRSIKSEEDSSVRSVSMWGERVPEYIYERVKSDKIADGIVNDSLFARKARGYLTEEILFRNDSSGVLTNFGEITTW